MLRSYYCSLTKQITASGQWGYRLLPPEAPLNPDAYALGHYKISKREFNTQCSVFSGYFSLFFLPLPHSANSPIGGSIFQPKLPTNHFSSRHRKHSVVCG